MELVKGPVPAWDIAFLSIPLDLYTYYGDKSRLLLHYENKKRYVSYLEKKANDDLITGGLGDWLSPVGTEDGKSERAATEGDDIISTMYYCKIAALMDKIAGILDQAQDQTYYRMLFKGIRNKTNDTCYDCQSRTYSANNAGYRQKQKVTYTINIPDGIKATFNKTTNLNAGKNVIE